MFASRYLQASAKHLNSILTGLVGSHSRRFITNSSRSAATTVGAHAKSQDLPHIEANRRARIELAAAYRGLEKLNLNEGVCNHLTLVAPAANGNGEVMLVIPYGLHWSEVTASSLLGTNDKGQVVEGDGDIEISAACIHLGVRSLHHQKCVMHTHAPYLTSLSTLKEPELTMTHQNAMRFYNKIAYDTNFEGPGNSMEEGKRLGGVLGNKEVMFMGNHGIMTVGNSVALTFDALYYLERVAMFQVLAMSTGKEQRHIPESVCQKYVDYYNNEKLLKEYAEPHFQSIIRRLYKECPEFAE